MHKTRWVLVGVAAATMTLCGPAAGTSAPAPHSSITVPATRGSVYAASAVLTGPVKVGHIIEPASAFSINLAAHGYVEQEFFASGKAHAFTATSAPADGRWVIEPSASAFYKTRIVVRRPASPAKFNGTVVVEWMNVSEGESAPDWDYLNPMLLRDGYAYVGVSAQALGVEGGAPIFDVGGPNAGLVHEEPGRYGTLHHPGDQYALDMYAQIGRALPARTIRPSWARSTHDMWSPSASHSPPSSSRRSPTRSSRQRTPSTASSSTVEAAAGRVLLAVAARASTAPCASARI